MADLFFCNACLEDKNRKELSPDLRYCQWCYDFLLKEAETLEYERTYWHRDGQIFFCDNSAWAIRKAGTGDIRELKTVCLGEERNVLERLKDTAEKIDKLI